MAASAGPPGGQPLSREDLAILDLENELVAGHTCKVLILDGPLDTGRLRSALAGRLRAAPKLALRLGDVGGEPWWIPGADVDLTAHVVDAEAPGDATLDDTVARVFARHLDRTRPLWQIDVIPGTADGGSVLIWRIHHALADGMTVMRMARAVLWDEPNDPSKPNEPNVQGKRDGKQRARATREHSVTHRPIDSLMVAAREAPQPWLRSPFDGHIGACRSVAMTTVRLTQVKQLAAAIDGATVNDVVLALVAGGLRRWLEAHHGRLGAVRVKVPVSLHNAPRARAAGPGSPAGNRDSYFCLDLPLGSADPLDRLATIRGATRVRKQEHDAQHIDALMRRLTRTRRLGRFAERVLANPRSFALNVSNVPGPRHPVQVLGNPVSAMYSLAEIGQHHALRIAVVSLAGTLNFGFVADPTLIPDVDQLASAVHAEVTAFTSALAR